MGSLSASCEIVEEKDDEVIRFTKRYGKSVLGSSSKDMEPKHKYDIDKLFQSIPLKPSTRLMSSSFRNLEMSSSAGPSTPSQSPRVDSVSLKQALRDRCISKASEIAAQKRLSRSAAASPRVSEAERIKSLYQQSSRLPPLDNKGKGSLYQSLETEPARKIELDENVASTSFVEDDAMGIEKRITSLPSHSCKEDNERISVTEKSKTARKVTRTIPRPKQQPKKKILLKKKLKIAVVSTKKDGEIVPSDQPLCQRCHCSLKSTSIEVSSGNDTKETEKFEFSLSSKDSVGDYSRSSTTSTSEESNRFSCGNKPHMSMDVRWEAIKHVKSRSDSLGLRHFNLLKKLGCGDIGTVYLAELIGTNCLFAIKVMDNEFLARRKKSPRAQAERDILKMLDHPFLPTLYAQFTSDSLSCLVMEYCPGGDLHVLRQKQLGRCFPEPAARFYVAEILLALEYLHMLGVIYRDLKPENILVRDDGHIMLTDFDLSLRCAVNPTLQRSNSPDPARVSGPYNSSNCIQPFCTTEPSCQVSCFSPSLQGRKPKRADHHISKTQMRSMPQLVAEPTEARSNSFVGTHEYLAPEIIRGEGHGAAVDWWTFGVLLYELLYGKTPFKGYSNDETLANVVLQSLKFPDSPLVSFQAKDLIRGLLVKEPENRLGSEKGSAEIKRHPFFQGLNWALIRCATPPELPDLDGFSSGAAASREGNDSNKYLECKAIGNHLEFELF